MERDQNSIPENGGKRKRFRLGDDEPNNGSISSSSEALVLEDRLSSLPDTLLVEILSLLPVEHAVATSVLSQRWRHLWTQVTRLHFSSHDSAMWRRFDCDEGFDKLCPIINHIFRQLTSPKIRSFLLHFDYAPRVHQRENYESCVESWIRQTCARNVEEIKVSVDPSYCLISLPTCVFQTQSLSVLELNIPCCYELPDDRNISLPNMKKIHLFDSDRKLMRLLFKACPLLEDLCLYMFSGDDDGFLDISAQYLKRLTILADIFANNKFRIDAPELEHFEVRTYSLSSYCFVRDSSRLVKAKISVRKDVSKYHDKISELVQGISSVRSLYLTNFLFYFVKYLPRGAVHIFHNLTHLKTNLFDRHGWTNLLRFLHCSPNLEALVLSHVDVDGRDIQANAMQWTMLDSVPVCLLNKLKSLEVEKLQGCQKELDFLGYILSNANVLERLLLRDFKYFGKGEIRKELKYCEDLFSRPRSCSVECEIEVYGKYLRASSKGFNKKYLVVEE